MKKMLMVVAVLLLSASIASAECQMCSNLKGADMQKTWGSRLGSGLCNVAFGWTEIFFRPGKVVAEGGNPIVGFFRGVGNAITRTGAGAVEVVTFWTPGESVASLDTCPFCGYK